MRLLHQGWFRNLSLVIVLLTTRGVLANDGGEPSSPLQQLAQANQQSHDQIRNLQFEYNVVGTLAEQGKSREVSKSTGHLYAASRENHQVRLRLNNLDGQKEVVDRHFANGVMREQRHALAFDAVERPLTLKSQRSFRGSITSAKRELLDSLIPPTLDRIVFMAASSPLSLSELIRQWNCQIVEEKGEEVTLRAEIPEGLSTEHFGSYVILIVRRDRGCQIQEARIVETNVGRHVETGKPANALFTFQVIEWQEPAPGIWFPKQVRFGNHGEVAKAKDEVAYFLEWTITSLTINAEEEPMWLGFQFPSNGLVHEDLNDGSAERWLLWGSNGMPEKIFTDADELFPPEELSCGPAELILDLPTVGK